MSKSKPLTIQDLAAAPYNPRKASKKQKEELKKSMEDFGDLSGIVFNRRTGHLIGGHLRIAIMKEHWENAMLADVEQVTQSKQGTVAHGKIMVGEDWFSFREVDWDQEKERDANIRANANSGSWDKEKLLKHFELPKLESLGLTLPMLNLQRVGFVVDKEKKMIECPKCGHTFEKPKKKKEALSEEPLTPSE